MASSVVDTPPMDIRVTEDQPKNLFRVTTRTRPRSLLFEGKRAVTDRWWMNLLSCSLCSGSKQVYLFNAETDGEMELWMKQLIAVSITPEAMSNDRLLVSPSSSPTTAVSPRLLESPRAYMQSPRGREDPPM